MSSPLPTPPSVPETPQEALGIPNNPLGSFPRLGGSKGGARRRSRGPGGGLPSNPLGRGTPRTPGTQSASERRAQAKANLHIVRPQPKETPSPAPANPQPGRTAHDAPERAPREVPKTGEARDLRDAVRHGMSKDTRRFHEGLGHEAQDQFNKKTRADQDLTRRELNDMIAQRLRAMREESLRQAREARKPARPRTEEQKAGHRENLKPFEEALRREQEDRAARDKAAQERGDILREMKGKPEGA
jgi:hypothetical protein